MTVSTEIDTNFFIGDIFWCVSICLEQSVKFTNSVGKLFLLLANEMMQRDVTVLVFVHQFVMPLFLVATDLQRVSRNWKHLILKHLAVYSNDSWTLAAQLRLQ